MTSIGACKCGAQSRPPVFIHSSWRTSSTWVWLKFRQLPETMSYYEPFHGLLAKRTRAEAQSIDYRSWDSNHPPGDPYGLEYLPLIRETGGVPFSEPAMAFEWFIPLGGIRGRLRDTERKYLGFPDPVCRAPWQSSGVRRHQNARPAMDYKERLWRVPYFPLSKSLAAMVILSAL